MRKPNFPPYELVEPAVAAAEDKTQRLRRLYHLTQAHAWDGRAVLAALIEKHGPPGRGMPEDVRGALSRLLATLLWGELAAWNISADLALAIDDTDAKMAATGQVFDEARHFTVLRDYLMMLGPVPRLGAVTRTLLRQVMGAPSLATKLVGMQLLFETNAVVIFRRLAESGICPILAELLPYFERDESRHVALGVLYMPALIRRMGRAEAARTAFFQLRAVALLLAGVFVHHADLRKLGLDPRQLAQRVTVMQDDVVNEMVAAHGDAVLRALFTSNAGAGPFILDFVHPPAGIERAAAWHRRVHGGIGRALVALDRAFA
jgi:hypothetical protein